MLLADSTKTEYKLFVACDDAVVPIRVTHHQHHHHLLLLLLFLLLLLLLSPKQSKHSLQAIDSSSSSSRQGPHHPRWVCKDEGAAHSGPGRWPDSAWSRCSVHSWHWLPACHCSCTGSPQWQGSTAHNPPSLLPIAQHRTAQVACTSCKHVGSHNMINNLLAFSCYVHLRAHLCTLRALFDRHIMLHNSHLCMTCAQLTLFACPCKMASEPAAAAAETVASFCWLYWSLTVHQCNACCPSQRV